MIELLKQKGELDNTIIIVTADNGMPFPRAKGFQYDYATHLPLAIFWPNGIKNPGRTNNQLISNIDIVPTLYDLALSKDDCKKINTSGVSLRDIFEDKLKHKREFIVLGKERHDVGRPLNQGYPIRSIRYKDYLYIYNFKPQLWPSGNPETGYLNTDGSPTKSVILNLRRQKIDSTYWSENFGFHPQEELYNLKKDRECLQNLAQNPKFQKLKSTLKNQLFKSLKQQKDPRVMGNGDVFDNYPFDKADSWNFYERYMKGEIEPASTNWVNESDYEKRTNIIKRK
jgi:arylsulfatase A-like enzyme